MPVARWAVCVFDGAPNVTERERISELEKALRFYADPRGTKDEFGERIPIPDFYDELEFGEYARRVLVLSIPALQSGMGDDVERPQNWPIQSFDAHDWAQEFQRIALTLGYSKMDEGWLITWFANAIMRGYDEHLHRSTLPRAAESESGYAASLRQQAAWIREALDAQSNPLQRIGMEDIDTDELDASAAHIEKLEARAVLTPEQAEWKPTHRHVKSGNLYRVHARGNECTNGKPVSFAVIYQDRFGSWWVRDAAEFDDGRFVALSDGQTQARPTARKESE